MLGKNSLKKKAFRKITQNYKKWKISSNYNEI